MAFVGEKRRGHPAAGALAAAGLWLLLSLCAGVLGGCAGQTGNGPETVSESGGPETASESGGPERISESGSPAQSEDGLTRMLAASVKITAGGLSGSGVVYEEAEDGLVLLTAGHVLADVTADGEADCSFYDGFEVSCQEFWVFPEADCAFLRIPYEALPSDWRERYRAAEKDREAFDSLEAEEGVFLSDPENENTFGYRFALLLEKWIYVEDFGQYMMLLNGEAEPGMSGCGVYDEDGCFLGILCGENGDKELAVVPYSAADAVYTQLP